MHVALLALADAGKIPPCRGRRRGRWTSDNPDEREWAAQVCINLDCPVTAECLAAGVELKALNFVWGGRDFTPPPRRQHQTQTTAARTEGRM